MGTPIDEVTGREGTGGSLATDKGGGRVEAVLVGVEGAERDTD